VPLPQECAQRRRLSPKLTEAIYAALRGRGDKDRAEAGNAVTVMQLVSKMLAVTLLPAHWGSRWHRAILTALMALIALLRRPLSVLLIRPRPKPQEVAFNKALI
jgi:hypothetical protein